MSLLKRTKRNQLTLLRSDPTDLEDSLELVLDLDLITGRRIPRVEEFYDSDDDELPDHILERLAEIRARAMEAYRKSRSQV